MLLQQNMYCKHSRKFHHIKCYHITCHHITCPHITCHHITCHHITCHHITCHHITCPHITCHHICVLYVCHSSVFTDHLRIAGLYIPCPYNSKNFQNVTCHTISTCQHDNTFFKASRVFSAILCHHDSSTCNLITEKHIGV